MNLLQQAIEENEARAAQLAKMAEWAKAHQLDKPSDLAADVNIYEDYVSIEIRPGPKTFKKVRQAMGHGWRLISRFNGDTGHCFSKYYRVEEIKWGSAEKALVILQNATLADGITCRRVKVGEKTMPVYEVVCE